MNETNSSHVGGNEMTAPALISTVAATEINQQIATAKQYPRSISTFMREARALVTLNEAIAQQCIYALPRGGKTIEGPSARFAEIIAHAWGNSRAGARVVNEGEEFITAQGVMHDMERNVAITFEVQRRITDSKGRRYNADMIVVTGNAASSIALRNAILKAVPKAFWEPLYQEARKVVAGDVKTLANKRAEAIQQFALFGITKEQICAKLGRLGVADITADDLVTLFGLITAIKEGDTTPEDAFAVASTEKHEIRMPQPKQAARTEAPTAPPSPPDDAPAESAPKQADRPAKVPPPAAAPDAGDGKLATDGEKKWIANQLAALSIDLEAAMDACGITSFDTLSPDGFIAMKEWISAEKKSRSA